jgi:FtsP/CotA-like multicopper oxidase with cupredoxin domain
MLLTLNVNTGAGDFVYHCRILAHEDRGTMAIIRLIGKVNRREIKN